MLNSTSSGACTNGTSARFDTCDTYALLSLASVNTTAKLPKYPDAPDALSCDRSIVTLLSSRSIIMSWVTYNLLPDPSLACGMKIHISSLVLAPSDELHPLKVTYCVSGS